jgi:hypothetical protein
VLASVAFDAGVISPKFYPTLVVAAVLTSQIAGAWLDYVLRKGMAASYADRLWRISRGVGREPVHRLRAEQDYFGTSRGVIQGSRKIFAA